jgi:hypothetical protein
MKFLTMLILASAGTTAFAAEFAPYEKTYRAPDNKIVKVTETKKQKGKLRCQVGEVPASGGLNVLENLGWMDCSELKEAKASEYSYAQDADELNAAGEGE